MELIDRDELIAEIKAEHNNVKEEVLRKGGRDEYYGGLNLGLMEAINIAKKRPVVAVVRETASDPVKHALWGFTEKTGHYCSACGSEALCGIVTAYCPVCGARMDATTEKAPERDSGGSMTDYERVAFQNALDHYGKSPQIAMVMEEMSELQKELCKNLRGADNVPAISEEIADVSIMLDQMKILFNCERDAERVRTAKVYRLMDRIASEREAHSMEWVKEGAENGI